MSGGVPGVTDAADTRKPYSAIAAHSPAPTFSAATEATKATEPSGLATHEGTRVYY